MTEPGAGISLGVLELDWPTRDPIHPAIPHAPPAGARGFGVASHALATASLLLSTDPGLPGLCPFARTHLACPTDELAPALERLGARLEDGGVLLVEVSFRTPAGDVPLEHDADVRPVLDALSERLVVVLPAGNSGLDLGRSPLPRSGAWVVSACDRDGAWFGAANHGSRVDLHERGDGVPTLGAGASVSYRHTSAAAALVAGQAVLAQQVAREATGRVLEPAALLERIVSTGTPATRAAFDPPIGVRPDLHAFTRSLRHSA